MNVSNNYNSLREQPPKIKQENKVFDKLINTLNYLRVFLLFQKSNSVTKEDITRLAFTEYAPSVNYDNEDADLLFGNS